MRSSVAVIAPRPNLPDLDQPVCVCKPAGGAWQTAKGKVLTLLYFEVAVDQFVLGDVLCSADAGELWILPTGSTLRGLGEGVWRVSFQLDLLSAFGRGLGDSYPAWDSLQALSAAEVKSYHTTDVQLWNSTLRALAGELTARDLGYCETSKAYLTLLLVQLLRLAQQDLEATQGFSNPLVARVMGYLDQHYAEEISLSSVAEVFHRSPAYLTTLFKQETGRSLHDCIIERRMAEAKRLLQASSLAVAQIGERVGYPEATHFSRLFRKRVGLSPAALRLAESER